MRTAGLRTDTTTVRSTGRRLPTDMTTRPLILIADDETRIRRLTAEFLEQSGFDVCQAQDGEEALEVFRRSPVEPDLVVLDLMMPVKDGHETLAELRTFSKVPVMILTARDLLQDKTKSFNTGADDYLVKPFAFAELEVRIRALLRRASGSDCGSRRSSQTARSNCGPPSTTSSGAGAPSRSRSRSSGSSRPSRSTPVPSSAMRSCSARAGATARSTSRASGWRLRASARSSPPTGSIP